MSGWTEDMADLCSHFQLDLSCLVDGELDESAAGRAMLHLESCEDCRRFFEDTRQCMRMHLDIADPDRLMARMATLTGADLMEQARGIELVHRLATIFYQLGKAYVLAALDPDYRTRVFEAAVPIEKTQTQGRGFVDGVLHGNAEAASGVDWRTARSLLNGRLKKIDSPLEKGRKLLEEAVAADPSHEEARLYLAYVHATEGRILQASDEYRAIFDTAMIDENRGHAIVQLGRLYEAERDYRRALICFRWVTISGLANRDPRFYYVRFNIGLEYAQLGDQRRALDSFRLLLDRDAGQPERMKEIVTLFARSKNLQQTIESRPGFAEALVAKCPELFDAKADEGSTK
jgi:tetratricopeptide (TPR) repeat protein